MKLQTLLGELKTAEFIERYFHRVPFSMPRAAQPLCDLGTWDLVGRILGDSHADVMVVRDGSQYSGPNPTNVAAAQSLSCEGYTVLVRHAERHDAQLAELAKSFADDLAAPVNIHIYATPPNRHGFGWHFDAEDVFIIQTGGSKEYSLRKNTVHPWPLVETIPDDMRFEREIMPVMRVLLAAGDWLYIPCGYWHKADARGSDDTSISLAVGVLSPAAVHVLEFAREYVCQSLIWRQRLPVCAPASELSEPQRLARFSELFGQLADDLRATLRDERFVRAFLERCMPT